MPCGMVLFTFFELCGTPRPRDTANTLWTLCWTTRKTTSDDTCLGQVTNSERQRVDPNHSFVFRRCNHGSNDDAYRILVGACARSLSSTIDAPDSRGCIHEPRFDCVVSTAEASTDAPAIATPEPLSAATGATSRPTSQVACRPAKPGRTHPVLCG
jgi:hypothetical protein